MREVATADEIRCAIDTMFVPDTFRISFTAMVTDDWDTLDDYQDQIADD